MKWLKIDHVKDFCTYSAALMPNLFLYYWYIFFCNLFGKAMQIYNVCSANYTIWIKSKTNKNPLLSQDDVSVVFKDRSVSTTKSQHQSLCHTHTALRIAARNLLLQHSISHTFLKSLAYFLPFINWSGWFVGSEKGNVTWEISSEMSF